MKSVPGILLALFFAGCAPLPRVTQEVFAPAPRGIDFRTNTASIEEYILTLPHFAYHEESVEGFAERVRRARVTEHENAGRGPDFLYVGGDGTWPAKEFSLDRNWQMLTIRVINREHGTTDEYETMRRVPGGWMRGRGTGAPGSASREQKPVWNERRSARALRTD